MNTILIKLYIVAILYIATPNVVTRLYPDYNDEGKLFNTYVLFVYFITSVSV